MTLSLQTLGNDTDYIAKHNSNYAVIKQAIEGLQQAAGGAGGTVNITTALQALFPADNAVIGAGSYVTTIDGATLDVDPGFAWLVDPLLLVSNPSPANLDPAGQSSGTLYVAPDATGSPTISTDATNALYSFSWNGSAISSLTRTAVISWGGQEWAGARNSGARGENFDSPDARFEALETENVNARNSAARGVSYASPDARFEALETENVNAVTVAEEAAASGTVTLDARQQHHSIELAGNITVAFSNIPAAGTAASLSIVLQQDATGGHAVTWPASVLWPGGTAPTITAAANAIDQIHLTTLDGGSAWLARAWQAFA